MKPPLTIIGLTRLLLLSPVSAQQLALRPSKGPAGPDFRPSNGLELDITNAHSFVIFNGAPNIFLKPVDSVGPEGLEGTPYALERRQ